MSSNLMNIEKGGEQTQYEGAHTDEAPHKRSGGQLGQPSTTEDPNRADGAASQAAERGQKTAENIRYGQTISEGGMSGFTTGQRGGATQEGYGAVEDREGEREAGQERRAAGYGGAEDQNREIGA